MADSHFFLTLAAILFSIFLWQICEMPENFLDRRDFSVKHRAFYMCAPFLAFLVWSVNDSVEFVLARLLTPSYNESTLDLLRIYVPQLIMFASVIAAAALVGVLFEIIKVQFRARGNEALIILMYEIMHSATVALHVNLDNRPLLRCDTWSPMPLGCIAAG